MDAGRGTARCTAAARRAQPAHRQQTAQCCVRMHAYAASVRATKPKACPEGSSRCAAHRVERLKQVVRSCRFWGFYREYKPHSAQNKYFACGHKVNIIGI